MIYRGANRYHSFYDDMAHEIGEHRNFLNAERMRQNPAFARGAQEEHVSYLGVLAEMIVRDLLRLRRIPHWAAPIIAPVPQRGPDVIFWNKTYDTKCVDRQDDTFRVNDNTQFRHESENYLFVILEDNYFATVWEESWENVSGWTVKDLKYSKAFCTPIASAINNADKDEWKLQPLINP